MSNAKIVAGLLRLRAEREAQGGTYQTRAYEKAILSIKKADREGKQITSGKEAMALPGIGKGIASHIDNILAGTEIVLTPIELVIQQPPEGSVEIELFKQIHGVGDVTAKKWYEAGYRTIEDVRAIQDSLPRAIRIGLQYFEHLQRRVPHEEIQKFELDLKQWASDNLPGVKIVIAGSYRRGKKDSGDIDVIVSGEARNLLEEIQGFPLVREVLGRGEKKLYGIAQVGNTFARIDFERVLPIEFPYALLYFTGSKGLNEMMRARAKELGYRLNEKSMYDTASGIEFIFADEREIFEFLGMSYLPPNEREI